MPLIPGSTPQVISQNIKNELAVKKPRKQAIAIALRVAGKKKSPKTPPNALVSYSDEVKD